MTQPREVWIDIWVQKHIENEKLVSLPANRASELLTFSETEAREFVEQFINAGWRVEVMGIGQYQRSDWIVSEQVSIRALLNVRLVEKERTP